MSVVTPVSPSSNPLLADALHRAQALAKPSNKRPSEESLPGPDFKKPLGSRPEDNQQQLAQHTRGAPHHNMQAPGLASDQVMVPDNMVGLIIGRGGEQITRLQAESGCKIQMSQDNQGMAHRLCTLTGSPEAIAIARNLIENIIANEGNRGGRGGGGDFGGGGGPAFEMMVPGHTVARIIGKGGETIKALQEETGAKIVIIQDSKDFQEEKPLKITGPPDKVEFAKQKVEQVIAEENDRLGSFRGRGGGRGGGGGFRGGRGDGGFRGGRGGGRGGGWPSGGGGGGYGGDGGYDVTDTMSVPSNKVGLVMGKGGETIRNICSQSGAHCQVDKAAPEGAREKSIVIKGSADAVERAKQMINEKIGGGYGGGGGGYGGRDEGGYGGHGGHGGHGGGHGGYGGPPAGGPPGGGGGQPDYSAQWAEYYRSLGMVKEAEIIEGQAAARAPAAVAAAPASDYSAQWAEYYRSMGKVKEAEAIEQQMRAKSGSVPPSGGQQYGGQPQYGGQYQAGPQGGQYY